MQGFKSSVIQTGGDQKGSIKIYLAWMAASNIPLSLTLFSFQILFLVALLRSYDTSLCGVCALPVSGHRV